MVALTIMMSVIGIDQLLFDHIAAISSTQISAGIVQGAKCANANAIPYHSTPFRIPKRRLESYAFELRNASVINFLKNDPQSENW